MTEIIRLLHNTSHVLVYFHSPVWFDFSSSNIVCWVAFSHFLKVVLFQLHCSLNTIILQSPSLTQSVSQVACAYEVMLLKAHLIAVSYNCIHEPLSKMHYLLVSQNVSSLALSRMKKIQDKKNFVPVAFCPFFFLLLCFLFCFFTHLPFRLINIYTVYLVSSLKLRVKFLKKWPSLCYLFIHSRRVIECTPSVETMLGTLITVNRL